MKSQFLLLAFLSLILISCSSDNENERPEVAGTTYQIINNIETISSPNEGLDGTFYEVVVLKYVNDDIVGQDNLGGAIPPNGGTSSKIEIDEEVEKVKVSFKYLPEGTGLDVERTYTFNFIYITIGENNEIIIDQNTWLRNGPLALVPGPESKHFQKL